MWGPKQETEICLKRIKTNKKTNPQLASQALKLKQSASLSRVEYHEIAT